MEENKIVISINKKKLKKIALICSIILLFTIIVIVIFNQFSPYNSAVVKLKNGDIYRVKIIYINDKSAFLKSSENKFEDFEIAYSYSDEIQYKLRRINISQIESIHYILEKVKEENTADEDTVDEVTYDPNIFGTYKIKVSGHEGFLYLRNKNGKIYGGLKFPEWSNGVYEPIKRLRIKGYGISFTRSATSVKEIRRLGISTYFTQTFSGKYNKKTKEIKGFYVNKNAKKSWNAKKIK